ncbi:MAG: hypothetical protein J0L73_27940 [Verrucomicrobia bacterium]|nr:hypothetical protein [Verrucomicrobiota bacterium]
MWTPLKIRLAIFLSGAGCLIATFMLGPGGIPLFIGWIILANIIELTLTCEKCGRSFTSRTMPLATRGRYSGVCTRCRPRPKK